MLQDARQGQKYAPEKETTVARFTLTGSQHKEHDKLSMKDSGQNLGLLIGKPKFFRDTV